MATTSPTAAVSNLAQASVSRTPRDRTSPSYASQHYFTHNGRTPYEFVHRTVVREGIAQHPDFPVLQDAFCQAIVGEMALRSLRRRLDSQSVTQQDLDPNKLIISRLREMGFAGYPKPTNVWSRLRFALALWNRSVSS